MITVEWEHKDVWKFSDNKTFTVEVTRHEVKHPDDGGCFDSDGGQRWGVYAYIYSSHPHFPRFDDTDRMWQGAANAMPFHGGPSYLHRNVKVKDGIYTTSSIQVGADYNHDGDWPYSQQKTQDDAYGVFADARELVEWLQKGEPCQPQT